MDYNGGKIVPKDFNTTDQENCCSGMPLLGLLGEVDISRLTGREREVLHLLGVASSNMRIAHRLGISERTVKKHVANILEKLGLSSRLEAALVAIVQHDLVCLQ
ncbi:helix-turn-helix domain-containing protein [Streptomyces sp. WM6378]|uniref:helix-turn-helix domain-containing protein n=1 Tax=Streptomyces sp. WM6378 TaxID=1415557 RepID=UPI00099CCF6A|nr:helix-turn-helix transcriptional regulator [Streptomyces sp. WM6378]